MMSYMSIPCLILALLKLKIEMYFCESSDWSVLIVLVLVGEAGGSKSRLSLFGSPPINDLLVA